MKLQAIHHAGLVVTDLDRSIYFYHDVLGLPFANEPTPWFAGPELEQGVGRARCDVAPGVAVGRRGLDHGAHRVRQPPSQQYAPVANNHLGAAHVCFRVDDVRAKKAELESKGVIFYSDVNVVDEGPLAGWRWVYFSDPDGLALELVEVAYYLKDERDAASAAYLSRVLASPRSTHD